MSKFIFVIVFSLPLFATSQELKGNYYNSKYDYSISYPDFLKGEGEADAGDGQKISSSDKSIKLIVWAMYDVLNEGLDGAMKYAKEKRTITYKVVKDDFFVLSGFEGNNIFYRKTILSKDKGTVLTFEFIYPKTKAETCNKYCSKIAQSLKFSTQ
jgi:hypothetical protein